MIKVIRLLSLALILPISLGLFGCGETPTSLINTELVDAEEVAATFSAYKSQANHCHKVSDRPRVIISGFNVFGEPFNVSGLSTMSMAKVDFWPAKVELKGLTSEASRLQNFARQKDLTTSEGGKVVQRTLTINKRDYEVCFIFLDVQWDLAAAIILEEAQAFQPSLVIMSGVNSGSIHNTLFESGAINSVGLLNGFDQQGNPDLKNSPVAAETKILETDELYHKISLSWDAKKLAEVNAPMISSIAEGLTSSVGLARHDNNYICNNVSYAVMRGLSGTPVSLASGKIKFPAHKIQNIKVGFLHYPYSANSSGVADQGLALFRWNQVLAQSIDSSLMGVN